MKVTCLQENLAKGLGIVGRAVGMALSGPDTGGSQYFITHSPQPHLDGHYTVFGRVIRGFDVLDKIVQGDLITKIDPQ